MKKTWNTYMRRRLISDFISKLILGLIVLFLWHKFINRAGIHSLIGSGAFIAGLILLVLAWINYLRLDGIKISPKSNRKSKEDIFGDGIKDAESVLTEKELLKIRMLSALLAGLTFIVPSVMYSVFV